MPKYQYRCNDCGADHEVQQKFTDDALTVCPECQGDLRKVFGAVGVVFKGSGFYKTDNRAPAKSTAEPSKPAAKTSTESSTSAATSAA